MLLRSRWLLFDGPGACHREGGGPRRAQAGFSLTRAPFDRLRKSP